MLLKDYSNPSVQYMFFSAMISSQHSIKRHVSVSFFCSNESPATAYANDSAHSWGPRKPYTIAK